MEYDQGDRRRLAGRARTLHERLAAPIGDGSGHEVESIEDHLAQWREYVADGDEALFETRLDQLGLTVEECRERLRTGGWPADEPLPEWVAEIEALLSSVISTPRGELDSVGDDEGPTPFEEIVAAVVGYATERVEWDVTQLAPPAIDDLRRQLVTRVGTLCSHSLFIEFKTYVAERDEELALGDDPPTPDSPRRYYDAFVDELLSGGLASFFLEYAVLARLLATEIRQWIETVREFTERLAADRPALVEQLFGGEDPGRVTDVEVGGDPHAGGRTTMGIGFESGGRVAYKPRDLGVAAGFAEIVSWLNEVGEDVELRAAAVVEGDGYGWMEWVENDPCPDEAAVRRFYRRTGGVLCLLYALRFYDGHFENVVAAGDQPVVVDLETLARPVSPGEESDPDRAGAFREGTILETGLLPERTAVTGIEDGSGGDVPDTGGFGSVEATWSGLQIPEFTDVNTDVMELEYREERTVEEDNLPTLDGDPIEPGAYATEIERGFETIHERLRANRATLLADDGPLAVLDDVDVRMLTRPTRWYGNLLRYGQTPSQLRTGLAFGCRMELLAKAFVTDDEPEVTPSVYAAERDALLRRDIPRFSANTMDRTLYRNGAPVEASYFEARSVDAIERRIDALASDGLAAQRDYVQLAFEGKLRPPEPTAERQREEPATLEPVRRAERIFDRIQANARVTISGDKTWVLQTGSTEGVTVEFLGAPLYQGRIGLGIFGAALYDVTGDDSYRSFVDAVLDPVEETVRDGPRPGYPLGVAGDGSIVYGCTTIGRLLDDERYVELASDAAELVTPDRIRSDAAYDLTQGSAGAIHGLLALYDETGSQRVLDRALLAGDHLLSSRTTLGGRDVWIGQASDRPLQGAAHGVAGIAHALARLGGLAGAEQYQTAALESLAFERERYDPDVGNWLDARDEESGGTPTWCHGRAGIGLSRIGMEPHVDAELVSADVDRALAGVDPDYELGVDHVCCGNFGRVELLLEGAKRRTGDHEWRARSLAAASVERADELGNFRSPFMNERLYDPTFFMGEAGIGYSLLRLAEPSLPCVLRMA